MLNFKNNKLTICNGEATVIAKKITTSTGISVKGWRVEVTSTVVSESTYGPNGRTSAANDFTPSMFDTAKDAKQYALDNILEIAKNAIGE